jgi:hypothetical protein
MTKYEITRLVETNLETYTTAYRFKMDEISRTTYATDLVTLAATASRQLAVMQALEHILLQIADECVTTSQPAGSKYDSNQCPIARAMTS